MIFKIIIFGLSWALAGQCFAKLNVITTTTNLQSLVQSVGGDYVEVTSLTKGSQDPHFVDAKPSYMLLAARADLLVSVGLELESGWLPAIIGGARNTKIMPGSSGSLILGQFVEPLERLAQGASRDQGDVHPSGNPHFMLDPIIAGQLGLELAKRLGNLDPEHKTQFLDRAKHLQDKLQGMVKAWQNELAKQEKFTLIVYHRTLSYLVARLGIEVVGYLEPKPGVPPSAAHIIELIKTAKSNSLRAILVENFFNLEPALRIQQEVPGIHVSAIPVSVDGDPGVTSLELLYDRIVSAILTKAKSTK